MSALPENLSNSLIANVKSSVLRRVIRDDGLGGLWISHPAKSNQMYHIDRGDFDQNWRLYKSEDDQIIESVSEDKRLLTESNREMGGFTWDNMKGGPSEARDVTVNIVQQENVPTVTSEVLPQNG